HDLQITPRLQDAESILFMAGQPTASDVPTTPQQPERNEEILTMIKKLTSNSNQEKCSETLIPEDREYPGISFELTKQMSQGPYTARHYRLTNSSDEPMFLTDKDLWIRGDITLVLAEYYLEPGETTLFYVVTEQADEDTTPLR